MHAREKSWCNGASSSRPAATHITLLEPGLAQRVKHVGSNDEAQKRKRPIMCPASTKRDALQRRERIQKNADHIDFMHFYPKKPYKRVATHKSKRLPNGANNRWKRNRLRSATETSQAPLVRPTRRRSQRPRREAATRDQHQCGCPRRDRDPCVAAARACRLGRRKQAS